MFCATGKAETDQTAHAWLKTTRSAGSFERIKQVLELKLRKHKPKVKRLVQDRTHGSVRHLTGGS